MPSDVVLEFWGRFSRAARLDHDRFEVISFGDSSAMADELAGLIVGGRKRATAGLYRALTNDTLAPPKPGNYCIVVNGQEVPQCIYRTTEVRVGRLESVDVSFAFDEGEGDRSREYWLAEHRAFFGRAAAIGGFSMSDQIATVFERFVVVWPPGLADGDDWREAEPGHQEF